MFDGRSQGLLLFEDVVRPRAPEWIAALLVAPSLGSSSASTTARCTQVVGCRPYVPMMRIPSNKPERRTIFMG